SDDFYWTTQSSIPKCSGKGSIGDQLIDAEAFVCKQALDQIKAHGSYSGTLAQYRKDKGNWKWLQLATKDADSLVECADDSGLHGEGKANDVYARIGSSKSKTPFTSDAKREVDWGSSPTNKIYTVYSGN